MDTNEHPCDRDFGVFFPGHRTHLDLSEPTTELRANPIRAYSCSFVVELYT
jgi:hypothetical protein